MAININLEMLGTTSTMAINDSLESLRGLLNSTEISIEERIKIVKQITDTSDTIAKWDVISGAVAGEQDDRKKLINKLDNLGK